MREISQLHDTPSSISLLVHYTSAACCFSQEEEKKWGGRLPSDKDGKTKYGRCTCTGEEKKSPCRLVHDSMGRQRTSVRCVMYSWTHRRELLQFRTQLENVQIVHILTNKILFVGPKLCFSHSTHGKLGWFPPGRKPATTGSRYLASSIALLPDLDEISAGF